MLSPGLPFAGYRYVSDVLEDLLDARLARAAVRTYTLGLLDEAPGLRDTLSPVASYVGGKCMGYPAIWLLQQLEDAGDPREIIARCSATLCISLSTSIVDDLADQDEPCDADALALLYVLIGASSRQAASQTSRRRLHDALEACLDRSTVASNDRLAARRGDRIGAFFSMVAAQAMEDGARDESRARLVVETLGSFGRFCAHVDDAMDVLRDLQSGATHNVAVMLLREYLGRIPTASDVAEHCAWLQRRIQRLLLDSMEETVALAASTGSTRAVAALNAVRSRYQRYISSE